MTAQMMPLLREEARKRQANSGPNIYGGKPLMENFPEVVLKGPVRDIAAKAVGVGESIVQIAANVRDADPEAFHFVSPVSIQAAAEAASRILAKATDASWEPILEFAARIRVEPNLELLASLVAGGWRAVGSPEPWLRAKLAHDRRRLRIRECRRARRMVDIGE